MKVSISLAKEAYKHIRDLVYPTEGAKLLELFELFKKQGIEDAYNALKDPSLTPGDRVVPSLVDALNKLQKACALPEPLALSGINQSLGTQFNRSSQLWHSINPRVPFAEIFNKFTGSMQHDFRSDLFSFLFYPEQVGFTAGADPTHENRYLIVKVTFSLKPGVTLPEPQVSTKKKTQSALADLYDEVGMGSDYRREDTLQTMLHALSGGTTSGYYFYHSLRLGVQGITVLDGSTSLEHTKKLVVGLAEAVEKYPEVVEAFKEGKKGLPKLAEALRATGQMPILMATHVERSIVARMAAAVLRS